MDKLINQPVIDKPKQKYNKVIDSSFADQIQEPMPCWKKACICAGFIDPNIKFKWTVYRRLFKYTLSEWFLFLMMIVFLLVTSTINTYIPFMVGQILDKISNPEHQTWVNIEIIFNSLLLLAVCTYVRVVSTHLLEERIVIKIRQSIYRKFIYFDMAFYDANTTGGLNSRLSNDINQAKASVSTNVSFLLRNLIQFIFINIILCYLNWKLALITVMIVPIYGLVTIFYSSRNKPLVRKNQDILSQMSSIITEAFSCMISQPAIIIIKTFLGEQKEIKKFQQINKNIYNINYKRANLTAFYFTAFHYMPYLGMLLVLFVGSKMVQNGSSITPGQLTSFIMYCNQLSNCASGISNSYSNIINGTAAIQKVFQLMDYQPYIDEYSPKKRIQVNGKIVFDNVSFAYPNKKTTVIKSVNIQIEKGTFVAIVGTSGSGKSTLIKLLLRLYDPIMGCIKVNQTDIKQLDILDYRKKIACVTQQSFLFSGTIQDNITYGVNSYTQEQLTNVIKLSGADEFVFDENRFPEGIRTTVGERGNRLSGGQKQRVAISRALLKKPSILILDQATSSLDSKSEYLVQKSIQNLIQEKKHGLTLIVIAHRLSTVVKADRILMLQEGEVIEDGKHQQLVSKGGSYSKLVQKQLSLSDSSQKSTSEQNDSFRGLQEQ